MRVLVLFCRAERVIASEVPSGTVFDQINASCCSLTGEKLSGRGQTVTLVELFSLASQKTDEDLDSVFGVSASGRSDVLRYLSLSGLLFFDINAVQCSAQF